jgi:hypothetical protein
MRTESVNTSSKQNDVLGADARAVIEADFKEIQLQLPSRKALGTMLRDALGQLVSGQRR